MAARLGYTKSNRMRSLTDLYLTPLRSCRGTARMPCFSSHTGKTVCPPKSCFSDMSYSWTSTLRRASSGTVRRNVNSSSHIGTHWSSITLVFFITLSAFTPAIPTCTRSHHCNFTLSIARLLCKQSLGVKWVFWSVRSTHALLPYPSIEIWRRKGIEMSFTEVHAPPVSHINFHLLARIQQITWLGLRTKTQCALLSSLGNTHTPTLRVFFTGKLALGSNTSPFGPVLSKKSGFLT